MAWSPSSEVERKIASQTISSLRLDAGPLLSS
jgi:hypothetical protein